MNDSVHPAGCSCDECLDWAESYTRDVKEAMYSWPDTSEASINWVPDPVTASREALSLEQSSHYTEHSGRPDRHALPDQDGDEAYAQGWAEGYKAGSAERVNITDETHDAAARFLFRKDAPPLEPEDEWEHAPYNRKQIYYRSAEMIARIFNGWE